MDAKSLQEAGWELLMDHHIKEARKIFDSVRSLEPTWEKPYYALGVCYAEEKKYDEARALYKQCIELNPDWEKPEYAIGDSYRCEGNYIEALVYYKKASEKSTSWSAPYERVGTCLKFLNEYDEAIKWFEKALTLDQQNSKSYFGIGECLRSCEMKLESIPYYQHALQINPKYYQALCGLGQTYISLKKYGEALPLLKTAIRLKPDLWEGYYYLGEAYLLYGETEKAEYCFRLALREDSLKEEVYEGLGMIYLDMEEYELAREISKQAIAINPDWPKPYGILGQSYLLVGQFQTAILYFNQQIERDKNNSQPYYGKAEAYFYLNDCNLAISFYKEAIELAPEWNRPYSGLGNCWRFKGQTEKAKSSFLKSIALDETWFNPYFGMGDCFGREGNVTEAKAWYQKSLEKAAEKDKYLPYFGLGSCYLAENNFVEAKNSFYQSLSIQEKDNPSYLQLFILPPSVFDANDPQRPSFLFRFVFVNENLFEESFEILLKYSLTLDAPAFTAHLLHKYKKYSVEQLSSFLQLQTIGALLEPLEKQFFHWQQQDPNDIHIVLFKSICEFYLGNPESTYHLLAAIIEKDIVELPIWGYLYYFKARRDLLVHNTELSQSYFLNKCNQILKNEQSTEDELYYAAQILYLEEKFSESISILDSLSSNGCISAQCELLRIRLALNLIPQDKLETEFAKLRVCLLQRENYFVDPHVIQVSGKASDAIRAIFPLMKYMECKEMLELILSFRRENLSKIKPLQNRFDTTSRFTQYLQFSTLSSDDSIKKIKEHNPEVYSNIFGHSVMPLDRGIYMSLGRQIFNEAFVIYYKIKDSLQNIEWSFEHRLYLQKAARHYKAGYLSLQQTTILQEYTLYCMEQIATLFDGEAINIVLDEAKGLIDTASYLGIGFGTLERVIRYGYRKIAGHDSPILPFEEFILLFNLQSKNQ